MLHASAARNSKDILRLCDVHGVDHATPVGATPLMLAARAANVALVDALLERGADPQLGDDFGHSAWQQAVSRAMEEPVFAKASLAPLFDRLAPAALDVQTDGRLVRLERHQGEYGVLTLMLAAIETQWSLCAAREQGPYKFSQGFFAEQLHEVLKTCRRTSGSRSAANAATSTRCWRAAKWIVPTSRRADCGRERRTAYLPRW